MRPRDMEEATVMDNEPDAFETVCADMIPHLFCDSFKCRYTQACAGSLQFITDWGMSAPLVQPCCINMRQRHRNCEAVPFLLRA